MHDAHEKYINHVLILGANDNSIYHEYSAAVGQVKILQIEPRPSQLINIIKISHIFIFINYRYFGQKYNQQFDYTFMSVTHHFRFYRLNSGVPPQGRSNRKYILESYRKEVNLVIDPKEHFPQGVRNRCRREAPFESHGVELMMETNGSYCHTTLSH